MISVKNGMGHGGTRKATVDEREYVNPRVKDWRGEAFRAREGDCVGDEVILI